MGRGFAGSGGNRLETRTSRLVIGVGGHVIAIDALRLLMTTA